MTYDRKMTYCYKDPYYRHGDMVYSKTDGIKPVIKTPHRVVDHCRGWCDPMTFFNQHMR